MFLNPKKITDQTTFKPSCIENKINPFLVELLFLFIKTKYKEIPIIKNNKVQTGAKIQFDGLKDGFCIALYQTSIELDVNIEPINPAN